MKHQQVVANQTRIVQLDGHAKLTIAKLVRGLIFVVDPGYYLRLSVTRVSVSLVHYDSQMRLAFSERTSSIDCFSAILSFKSSPNVFEK